MVVLCEFSEGWCNIHFSNVDSPKSLFYARTRVNPSMSVVLQEDDGFDARRRRALLGRPLDPRRRPRSTE